MKRLGTRLALLVALGCAIAPTTGVAQPASALGQMLPDGSLPTGTLSVKVIAGESAKILPGTDVHVTINGDERIARTGPDGRATLPGVPAGATLKVTIKGASGDVSSDTLTMPDNGGARVMLSTVPMIDTSATGAPPPMAAGGAGRPQPRQMSGKARPDPSVPGGELQVLVTYDELFSKTPPVGEPVMLVGYRADEKIAVMVEKTDDTGHVHFKDLDRSGGTVYFAMARLPRGTGVDRMWSVPIQMDPTAGAKAMLSAEARTSTAKPVDDLAMVEPQPVLPSGRVMASIVGVPEDPGTVSLVDAATGKVVMTAKTEPETPAPGSVTVDTSPLTPDKSTGTAVLGIQLAHAGAAGVVPVPDVTVMVRRAPIPPPPPAAAPAKAGAGSGGAGSGSAAPGAGSGSAAPGAGSGSAAPAAKPPGAGSGSAAPAPAPVADEIIGQGVSAKDGYLTVSDLPTGTPLVIELTTNGQTVRSSPFTLPASGGSQIMLRINWQQRGNLQAIFNNVPDGATTVYYLETEWRKAKVRSLPFQVVDGRGTTASLLLYPRLLFRFQLDAWVEDDFLAVQGDYILRNYSWFPYTGGEDGINIPLPHGFKGAIVDRDKDVAKDASGFHVLRPLPPFEFKFRGGFSMAIGSDTISWDQPAPLGIYQSDLAIRLLPGMSAIPPTIPNVDAGEVAEGTTKFYAIQKITLPPSRPDSEPASLQFSITGLPSQPAWKVWAPRAVGVLVLLALAIAAFVALSAEARKNKLAKSSTAERSARVEALYDELAAIDPDATGELAARRAALYAELERLVANERA